MHIPEFDKKITIEQMTPEQRLKLIANVIESVDNRCMTHTNVSKTLDEMTQKEISQIYSLAKGESKHLGK